MEPTAPLLSRERGWFFGKRHSSYEEPFSILEPQGRKCASIVLLVVLDTADAP